MYLPLFLCLYESFWKEFESDQRRMTMLAINAGYSSNVFACLARCKYLKTLKFFLTFLMLTINSRSPWEMISGFNLTFTRRDKG